MRFNTFVRSFAYISGPAYGFLLQEAVPGWTTRLTKDSDLGELLSQTIETTIEVGPESRLRKLAERYDGATLWANEVKRKEERRAKIKQFSELFVKGQVIRLPLGKHQMSFNPSYLVPLDPVGTVYTTLSVSAPWGELKATMGAMITKDFSSVVLSAPNLNQAKPLIGDGWALELNEGWKLAPGDREGDWKVIQE